MDEDDVISTLDDNYQVQMKVRALVKEKRKQRRKHKGMQKSSNCSSRHALNVSFFMMIFEAGRSSIFFCSGSACGLHPAWGKSLGI